MRLRLAWLCALLVLSLPALPAPNVLTTAPSADTGVLQAPTGVNGALGPGFVDNPIFIDYDTANIFTDFNNVGAATIHSMASGLTANHAPYRILSYPFASSGTFTDVSAYAALSAGNVLAAVPALIHSIGTPLQLPATAIVISSPNSFDGQTGYGVEMSLSASYLGIDTSSDSNDTGGLAGIIAALMFNHPAWNAFDIHGAFRQTAANWATGYDATHFGYGALSYSAANAVASTSAIYLQAPNLQVKNNFYYARITLYPFRTTRRSNELIYSVNPSYVWPVKNEYTASDIAASGATLLYTSNGTDSTPQYTYSPTMTGTVTLVAFTTDGSGNYSRVESYSEVSASLTVGNACLN